LSGRTRWIFWGCRLFYGAVLDYGEWWIGKDLVGIGPGIRLGGLRKTTKKTSEYSMFRPRIEESTSRKRVLTVTAMPACSAALFSVLNSYTSALNNGLMFTCLDLQSPERPRLCNSVRKASLCLDRGPERFPDDPDWALSSVQTFAKQKPSPTTFVFSLLCG
jgi:hypothetical protein